MNVADGRSHVGVGVGADVLHEKIEEPALALQKRQQPQRRPGWFGRRLILGLGLGQKRLDLGAELRIAERPDFALQRQLDTGQAEAAQHQDDKKVGHETAGEGQEDNYSRGKVHGLFLGQG